jgi:polar amino acid transport system substrate-binding protein
MCQLVRPGVLSIGVDESPPPPFHMGNPASEKFEGFEVDLTRTIAGKLRLKPEYHSELWSKIWRNLREGRLDMICTAATVTEQRKQIIDFSLPYFDTFVAITVRRDDPIRDVCDLADRTIGVRLATSAEEVARQRIAAREFCAFDLNVDAYNALASGSLDAVIDDYHIARSFEFTMPEIKVAAKIPDTSCQYAMMFAKGNDTLRNSVNSALNEIRGEGSYDVFYRRWFGEDEDKNHSRITG